MTRLRPHLLRYRWLACWLVGLALLVRIVVPAGYMPTFTGDTITVELCSGYGPMNMTMARHDMAAMSGMPDRQDKPSEHGKGEMPCGFSGLLAHSLAGTDPILLTLAIAFIVASGFVIVAPSTVTLPNFLRPQLRGPPTAA